MWGWGCCWTRDGGRHGVRLWSMWQSRAWLPCEQPPPPLRFLPVCHLSLSPNARPSPYAAASQQAHMSSGRHTCVSEARLFPLPIIRVNLALSRCTYGA
jgi:hypothetical protein